MSDYLPFSQPYITDDEINQVIDCLKSGWLTYGARSQAFEAEFQRLIGAKHALAVSSATAGLHLALDVVGIKAGDAVITTPHTFVATAQAIHYVGAKPVFVDVDPATLNMDVTLLEDAIKNNPSVKAILPVHFAGLSCDMKPIMEMAKRYDLFVIDDAAHAFNSRYLGENIGRLCDLTVFSFYPNKAITTGEGGMVVTDNDEWADKIRIKRSHGIDTDAYQRSKSNNPAAQYSVATLGYKYNMNDLSASLGIQQIGKAGYFLNRRQAIANRYTQAFQGLALQLPVRAGSDGCYDSHAWHLYVIQLELDVLMIDRDQFVQEMHALGIGTSVHYRPIHMQPFWRDLFHYVPQSFPASYHAYCRSVSLPIYPLMTDTDVDRVIEAVDTLLAQYAC